MLSKILSLFFTSGLTTIGEQLNKAYQAKLTAETDSDKISAEITIKELEARQAILIAEQSNWMTRWIRPAIALPVVVFLWKILLYDLVLKLGATDDPSPNVWYVIMTIVGAYFLARPFEKR